MEQIITGFGGVTLTVVYFIIALSIIVAIHEYGHYIVGRWSGIDADVFSIGFGPVLYSRVDRRGTRWQVAAFPLGGYVKFRGDADAASVTADAAVKPGRNTMLGAPLWARSATVFAGPLFNFIMSFVIFAVLIGMQGRVAYPPVIKEIVTLPPSFEVALEPGDRIIAIEGIDIGVIEAEPEVEDAPRGWSAITSQLPDQRTLTYTVERGGDTIDVAGPHPRATYAEATTMRSAARAAGIEPGDVVLSIDGEAVASYSALVERVTGAEGAVQRFEIWRDGETLEVELAARSSDEPQGDGSFRTFYRIGIQMPPAFAFDTEPLPIWSSMGYGALQVWSIIKTSLSGLYHMITGGISTCNLSGPVGIAEASAFAAEEGTLGFIRFIALLSTAVGLLNLFPIPVLDGGHLVFHAYEAVTGRPPAEKALQLLMAVGISLVLTLMLFGLANDIFLCR